MVNTSMWRHPKYYKELRKRNKLDQAAAGGWDNTSTVVTAGRTCPAPDQNNECKDCRACWNKDVKNIAYGKH